MPLLSEALAKGELGYSKVRALTRVATADNEAYRLDIGRHGTAAHVEKFARLYRQASRANETERADVRHRERGLTFWHEDDGTMVLHGRFPPEMAARILSALEAAMAAHATEQPAADWSQEHSGPPDVPRGTSFPKAPVTVRRADALAWMADRVFEGGDAPCAAHPRPRMPLPRGRLHLPAARTSRAEPGQGGRDLARQSGPALPVPPPTGARGRLRRASIDDAAYRFVSPHGRAVRPPRTPGPSSPEVIVGHNEALGLAIDGRTATARRDGEPVDYDQAVMVAMASWGPCGTSSEAGAATANRTRP